MFTGWDFLLVEIWVLIAIAAAIGLIAGWLIWGGRTDTGANNDADTGADIADLRRLRAELDHQRARSVAHDPLDDVPAMEGGGYTRPAPMTQVAAQTPPSPTPMPPSMRATSKPLDAGPIPEPDPPEAPHPAVGQIADGKPAGLDTARDGLPDDLTKIKGVGRKLETLLNTLGVYHYDQIADWSDREIAWVDDNLEEFKGRVTRDNWVAQAVSLARNQTPAFKRNGG